MKDSWREIPTSIDPDNLKEFLVNLFIDRIDSSREIVLGTSLAGAIAYQKLIVETSSNPEDTLKLEYLQTVAPRGFYNISSREGLLLDDPNWKTRKSYKKI